jgi:hypothetical protein
MSAPRELRTALRAALVAKLTEGLADPYDPYFDPDHAVSVSYRPTRRPIRLPAVTFSDSGVRGDSTVPLWSRTLRVDVWSADLDQAEEIAHKVNAMLDNQGLHLPGGEGKVAYLSLRSDEDQPQDDADLVRKMLVYTVSVYEWNGPPPFGEGA